VNDSSSDTYVVWGIPGNGDPVPLGTFDVTSQQVELSPVSSTSTGLDEYSTYAVSIEPGREAPATPSRVVADGTVTS